MSLVSRVNDLAAAVRDKLNLTTAALALKAPLASPALTGTPTAPTATAGTNTTQLATTAFVATAVSAGGSAGTQSDFGKEYDSMADMASFGLAPALVIYQWSLVKMVDFGWIWAKLGWLAAFIYVAGAALRLARWRSCLVRIFSRCCALSMRCITMGMSQVLIDTGKP